MLLLLLLLLLLPCIIAVLVSRPLPREHSRGTGQHVSRRASSILPVAVVAG
jgi:hypothetical protein